MVWSCTEKLDGATYIDIKIAPRNVRLSNREVLDLMFLSFDLQTFFAEKPNRVRAAWSNGLEIVPSYRVSSVFDRILQELTSVAAKQDC